MKKLATLFTDSYQELRQVRTITTAALFGALSIVLVQFDIILGPNLKIGISSLADEFVYYLFGPGLGAFYGMAMDLLKYISRPTAAFFPGWTISAVIKGILYGTILYKKPLNLFRVLFAELAVVVVCNMFLGTYWLSLMNGDSFIVILPIRVLKNLIQWPVSAISFYTLAKGLESAGLFKMMKDSRPI